MIKNSPYSTSLDDRLTPKPRGNSAWWKWCLVVTFAFCFVYRSTEPLARLKADPPRQFLRRPSSRNGELGRDQMRLACAYWEVAVRFVQLNYSVNKPLPAAPPPEFRVGEKAVEQPEENGSRILYWQRLREVWGNPSAWVVSEGWNTQWVGDTLNLAEEDFNRWLARQFQTISNWGGNILYG